MKSIYCGFKNVVIIIASLLFVSAAFALDLSDAKQQGLIGETESGYLGVLKKSSEIAALVSDINAKRRLHYQSIAAKNSLTLADVEILAGKKAIEKTPSGQYVKIAGKWRGK